MITEQAVLSALATIMDPDLHRDIVSLGFIKGLRIDGENVAFTIELTTPACPVREQMQEDARRVVLSLPSIKHVEVTMTSQVRATQSEEKDKVLPLVKNVVPVGSGKRPPVPRGDPPSRQISAPRPTGDAPSSSRCPIRRAPAPSSASPRTSPRE